MNVRKDHQRHSAKVTRSTRWKVLRMAVLERDGFACRMCGTARGRLEVDHIKPVRTNPELSFDPRNLQALCPQCHTRKTRLECGHPPKSDGRQLWDMAVGALQKPGRLRHSIPAGLRPSRVPVRLVFGPPGAGKTHHVAALARPGDLIIDLDAYLESMGGRPWDNDPDRVRAAFKAHDEDLRSLADRTRGAAWLVKLAPTRAERMAWRLALLRVQEVPILTSPQTCIQRIRAEPARSHRADEMCAKVSDWWRTFSAETGINPEHEEEPRCWTL